MGRWQPNARGRLTRAAYELYGERGYEQTTVAEIAKRAGLTERTFFRHFADKREVLFAGSEDLQEALVGAVTGAHESVAPVDAVTTALEAAGAVLTDREFSRQRQRIIDANTELRERELIKLARLAAAVAGALRHRGVPDLTASLAAEVGMAVFKVAWQRWLDGTGAEDLRGCVREAVGELKGTTTRT
ncbi:TetR/AcrR family transcriptional regulator [Actinoallomurus spadix]|uniref:TetR/AcrR family transcriptional regulator n=1 Tax=Actinoallomurus spadix TaxID=79912 RepID=A0ABP3G6V0_9ACTN|nr:TetR/AcrR family transcriptional regulator [Actinoallomurus spadix]MCO5990889.1 TetR/AcrR family transcriptional regulator [Actinoallomurus spadix]